MSLMTWANVDETQAYPWHAVACPGCDEPELARDITRPFTGFVCMGCGARVYVKTVMHDGPIAIWSQP